MKKLFFISFFIISISISSQDKGFGVGIIIGEPTGVSLKGWMTSTTAIDAGIAWSFLDDGSVHLHGDYLVHFNVFNTSLKIPLYVGIGGRIKFKNNKKITDNRIGVRVPFGIDFMLNDAPVDIFVELVPVLDLSPKTDINFNGAVGVRYFFK